MKLNGYTYSLEMEITTDCNLKCFNCNRSCRQAPSKENMSLDQIDKFVNESKKLGVTWDKGISLLGGEPSLHPDIGQVISKLYKGLDRQIRLFTNGIYMPDSVKVSRFMKNMVIVSTDKTGNKNNFVPFNMAPIDNPKFEDIHSYNYCKIIFDCGLGMSRYGFYICGPGASIDRIFGFDIGIKSLKDVTIEKLYDQKEKLCSHCGLLPFADYDPYSNRIRDKEMISDSWKKAYERYKINPPKMGLY
jgi:hypothetical protein